MAKKYTFRTTIKPPVNSDNIAVQVENYLTTNPPTGGLTINQIKADSQIAAAISQSHASGSDNQDLSGLQLKETGKGLSSNDYTTLEKNKLAGLTQGSTNVQVLTKNFMGC